MANGAGIGFFGFGGNAVSRDCDAVIPHIRVISRIEDTNISRKTCKNQCTHSKMLEKDIQAGREKT